MSDDFSPEDTTMWQKVRKPRRRTYVDDTGVEHESRRGKAPGLPYWLVAVVTLVPLITVLGSGFTAYVKRGAVIEQIQEEIDELKASDKAQWTRIGNVMEHHQ